MTRGATAPATTTDPTTLDTPVRRRPSTSALNGRVPPHNLEVDEAALGAMLLSSDACSAALAIVEPGDFYAPRHQTIAHAIARLMAEKEPQVDVVTVAELLRQDGRLDEIGGPQYLLELQNATPAISAAGRYARIVRDNSDRRRLIGISAAVSELAYADTDPATVVSRAQELFADADVRSRVLDRFADIAAVIAGGITAPLADRLERDDGVALCYSGRVNGFQGEPESGKTWAALIAMARTLRLGGTAAFIDLEDTAAAAIGRLRALGVTDRAITTGLRYMGRAELEGLAPAEFVKSIIAENPDDVLIDSVGELLVHLGLDENKAEDILTFRRLVVAPFPRANVTVYLIDHVVKDRESRGRWARGNGAKLGMMDGAVYSVHSDGFNRTTPGRVVLTLQKDRHGSLPGKRGDELASIYMQPQPDGELRVAIDTPRPKPVITTEDRAASKDTEERLARARLAARIEHALDANPAGGSIVSNDLKAKVRGGKDGIRFTASHWEPTIEDLREAGKIEVNAGPRGAKLIGRPATQGALDGIGDAL